jgi:phage tail P2-like protein
LPEDIKTLWDVEEADARFLSFLAWGLHVDFWRDELSEGTKRALIRNSFMEHRYKGTVAAVKRALSDFGVEVKIHEWFELGTPPHTFGVEGFIDDAFDEDAQKRIAELLETVKPARAHMEYVVLIPTPPDIALEHGYDICFYNECFYSASWWPRPILVPGGGAVLIPASRASCFASDRCAGKLFYSLAPVYDWAKYDERLVYAWVRPAKSDDILAQAIELHRKYTKPLIWTFSFAQGTYDDGEPMGSLNCVYGPRYRSMPPPAFYGAAAYGDCVEQPEWKPINRFYERLFIEIIRMETDGISAAGVQDFEDTKRAVRFGWGGPWGGSWNPGKRPVLEAVEEEMSSLTCAVRTGWGGAWGGSWNPGKRPVLEIVEEEMSSLIYAIRTGWSGAWGGSWGRRMLSQIQIIEEG